MNIQLFYQPDIELAFLDEEESRHCIQVLRHKKGDRIHITNGKGFLYECRITETHSKKCSFEIINVLEQANAKKYHLHIAIALTKNRNRFEWFLEKAQEIGIDSITPMISEQSERRKTRIDRMEKVMIAAMKQCLRTDLAALNDLITFPELLKQEELLMNYEQKYIAYVDEDKTHLKQVCKPEKNTLILIGPEGGFTQNELAMAKKQGFLSVSLGENRLRTETAGLVACHALNFINT